ncbi:MAG: Fic family protein [Methylococcaceae bacterium]|nr:Fic family protein [Methylococcaceae bacterium]
MKLPLSPPAFDALIKKDDRIGLLRVLSLNLGPTDAEGRYLHWDKLRHLQPPEDLTSENYWLALKFARKSLYKKLPFTSKSGEQFQFCMIDSIHRDLHWIDQNAAGRIGMDKPVTNPHTRDTYLVGSLIEEAISSSQLEGASTTRNVAKEMLRQGRKPKDHSEQMIFNNYQVMQFIREYKEEKLTPAAILHLHRLLTEATLDDANKAGQYRDDGDDIHVVDATASVLLHTPPEASELPGRIERLCQFANDLDGKEFIHPVIRAIILHFMIGYDHPFVDGNGRTARALFYWSMANQQYWLMEFISISRIIKQAPAQYGKAYLYSETDDNDLTYFIIHQLEVIKKAINALHEHLEKKAAELYSIEKRLDGSVLQGQLNHRQLAILRHALDHPNAIYSIQEHQAAHKISYQTARTDLLKLADQFKILNKRKYGNLFVFVAPPDLGQKLADVEIIYQNGENIGAG